MDVKNGKQYLPQTYQAYLANKKKATKPINQIVKMFLPEDQNNNRRETGFDLKKGEQILAGDSDDERQITVKEIKEKMVHSDYQKMFDDLQNNKFNSIVRQMQKEKERLKEETPVRTISINSLLKDLSIQSLENIENMEREFKIPCGKRNIQKIQNMLSFNKFFVILNRDKRFKIYDNCEFFVVEEGTEIYKEGDLQDYMYVVIKGCVKQFEKKATSYHQKITVNFLSHYEGSSFGEPQLVGGKQQKAKRHHSTIATERSHLLKIQNDFYRQLITNSAEDDFEKKLGSLLSTSIFCETSKIFVTPLLSTLERKVLNYGEVLIRQGQPVNKLYFIGDGNLQVIFIDRAKRSVKHLNIEEKPKNFTMRNNFTKGNNKKQKRDKNFSMHNTFYYENEYNQNDKEFLYGHKKLIGEELEYNDQIVFQELRNGDFLGGKSFLSQDLRNVRARQHPYFSTDLNAKLSVICSSISTTVYSLDEKKFFSLSDNLQKVIIDGITDSPYFDEKDFDSKINAQREWKKYAEGLVSHVISEKRHRNQSFRI